MLNKVLKLFLFLIGIVLVTNCSNNYVPIQLHNDNISYNKEKFNSLESYQNYSKVNLENWVYIYQNKYNILNNYSLKENHFNFTKLAKISLNSQYDKVNNIISNFVINEDVIYLINSNNYLITIDLNTFRTITKVRLPFLKKCSVVGLAYYNDFLYISTNVGKVFAIYKNGEESWSVDLMYPIQSSPIIDNDKLFIIANNTVYAMSVLSGDSLWVYNGIQTGITLNKAIVPTIYQNFIVVGLSNGTVLFLRKENGQLIWSYNINKHRFLISSAIIAPPIVVNNGTNILVSSFNGSIYLLNPLKSSEVWFNKNIGFINPPVFINNHIFILDTSVSLHNVDLNDGKIYWSLSLNQINKKTKFMNWFGPFLINNNILIYNYRGEFYIISPQSGNIVNKYQLNLSVFDELTQNIAFINQKIIVLGLKNIYILE